MELKNIQHALIWSAGFLEGEGYFGYNNTPMITVSQVEMDPIAELNIWFKGTVRYQRTKGNRHDIYVWSIYGTPAMELMFTLYPLLSNKRQSTVRKCAAKWKETRSPRRNDDYCVRGHVLRGNNLRWSVNGHKKCRLCYVNYNRKGYKKRKNVIAKTRLPLVAIQSERR